MQEVESIVIILSVYRENESGSATIRTEPLYIYRLMNNDTQTL